MIKSRKMERKMKDSSDASSRNQSSHRAAMDVTEPGANTPLTRNGLSLAGYIDHNSEIPDGEHRPVVGDAAPLKQLPRPPETVHESEHEDYFAPGLSDGL